MAAQLKAIRTDKVFCKTLPYYLESVQKDCEPIYDPSFNIDYQHPSSRVYQGNWEMVILSMYHTKTKYAEQFKRTYELIMDNVSNCHTVAISCLYPGTVIKPHIGMDKNLYRGHFYFNVPGKCQFVADNETWNVKNGDCFYFDDKVKHSANNLSNKPRYAVLFDMYIEIPDTPFEPRDDMKAWLKQNDAGINIA